MKQKPRAAPSAAARDGRTRRAPNGGGRRLVQQAPAPVGWQWHPRYWHWKRGLLRLWVVASFVWAGYWLYNLQLSCAFWFAPWCESPTHVDWPNGSMALGLAMVLLSGPILALLLGLGTAWAVKGFLARRAR